MKRLLPLSLLLLASCQMLGNGPLDERRLSHDVFFTLTDDSAEACEALARDCREMLTNIPSVLALDAGLRDDSQDGAFNDAEYDVVLHVIFADASGLQEYLVHADHLALVDRLGNVAGVRVFDSWVH